MKIYLIGIGGISMSGIAFMLKNEGHTVIGSDITKTEITQNLEKNGILVNYDQKSENITKDIDLVVYSAAIHQNNEEYEAAKKYNIKLKTRAEMLGEIMSSYKNNICIAGTHGKTTTSSMLTKVLIDEKSDPTVSLGAIYNYIDGNYRIGKKDYFVIESCEYTNSFLNFKPTREIITNIEEDHLDFFKDIDDIRKSFKKFIDLMDDKGILVINSSIDNISYLTKEYKGKIITYGIDKGDYYAKNIKFDINDYATYELYNKKNFLGNVSLSILGRHNVENSISVFALLMNMGIKFENIKNSIKDFNGASRRLEKKLEINGITIFDDYAHHPNEIKASINALNSIKRNKLYIIFQPHTYTRTKALFEEFVKVLASIDDLIMVDIYPAREENIYNISSKDIIDEINKRYKKDAKYFDSFDKAKNYIIKNIKEGDIVSTMGAGDVFKISDDLIKYYNKNNQNNQNNQQIIELIL